MANRTTSTVAEALANPDPNARVTQVVAEALSVTGPAVARVTAAELEVLVVTGPSNIRVTSTVLEALISVASGGGGWVSVMQ